MAGGRALPVIKKRYYPRADGPLTFPNLCGKSHPINPVVESTSTAPASR